MLIGAPLGQRFEGVTLADVEVHDGNKVAVELARRIVGGEALSLLLYGDTARGKTLLLAAILNEVQAKWPAGRYAYWPLSELALARRAAIGEGGPDPVGPLLDATLVAIDDIGVEATTDYVMEGLQPVVDRRWRDNRPLLLASNLDPTSREFSRRYGPRILRRFVDKSAWICEMGGDSWATKQAPRSPENLSGTDWTERLKSWAGPLHALERVRREREEAEETLLDPEGRALVEAAFAKLRNLSEEGR